MIARDALGFGLRAAHKPWLAENGAPADYLEIISENYLGDAEAPRRNLARARGSTPVVLHGVGLNLLGEKPPDEAYLDRLARLADALGAPFVTDHLCWTGSGGASHHDLLPAPHVPELVEIAAERAAYVQRRLDRPFGLENLSSYVRFSASTMTEWEFLNAVVRAAGCGYLLDVNNVHVSAVNHGFSAQSYLASIDWSRVLEVHLAGHAVEPGGGLVDTHDAAPQDDVWALYREAWRLGGPFPTLLEWDDNLPGVPTLVAELDRARRAREAEGA